MKMLTMKWLILVAVLSAGILKDDVTSSAQRVLVRPTFLQHVPITSFTCRDRPDGYYADMEANCQSYHMCDGVRQYSYLCPHLTLFHQKFMVCDHFVAVNCSNSAHYYDLNLKIGKNPGETKKATAMADPKPKPVKTSRPSFAFAQRSLELQRPSVGSSFLGNQFPAKPKTKTSIPVTSRPTPFRSFFRQPTTPTRLTTTTTTTTAPTTTTTTEKPAPSNTRKGITHPFRMVPPPTHNNPNGFSLNQSPFRIGGRGGGKVSFKLKNSRKHNTNVKLKPILVRPRKTFNDNRSFTVPSQFLRPTPPTDTSDEEEDVIPKNVGAIPPIPDVLLPPPPPPATPERVLAPFNQIISRFLIPPRQGPIVIRGENQEIRTPLSVSRIRGSTRASHFGMNTRKDVHLPSLRGNPDFFIPEPGLVPPLPSNSIDSLPRPPFVQDQHRMTMTFTDRRGNSRTLLLPFNPDCPRCHPAFLRPNQCNPCVIIK